MEPAIVIFTVLAVILALCIIKSVLIYYDFDEYWSNELFSVAYDEVEKMYYLTVKRKWQLLYRTCYWELKEPDGYEYYRVESVNGNGLYSKIANKNEMVTFFCGFPVRIKK